MIRRKQFCEIFRFHEAIREKHVSALSTTTGTQCQRSQRLRGHTIFANVIAKTKNFAKSFLPVHIILGPGGVFLKCLVTLSL